MATRVKSRNYDNRTRLATSDQRRSVVLATARRLFLERGYVRTTMAAVASEAGVAVDTVYELVGRKPALFRLLIETAISGVDQPIVADDRGYVRAMQAEPSASGKLRIYAEALAHLHTRLAPLVAVLQAAAAADPELAELWREISERRAANMHRLAAELESTGDLAVPPAEAADVIWATNSPELYLLLVHQRGWTPERYGQWLAKTWLQTLLRGEPR